MCGIAGILFKDSADSHIGSTTGAALSDMLVELLHRGPDSAGFALYREPIPEALRLRFLIGDGPDRENDISRIREALAEQDAEILEEDVIGCTCGVIVRYTGDVQRLSSAMEHAAIHTWPSQRISPRAWMELRTRSIPANPTSAKTCTISAWRRSNGAGSRFCRKPFARPWTNYRKTPSFKVRSVRYTMSS